MKRSVHLFWRHRRWARYKLIAINYMRRWYLSPDVWVALPGTMLHYFWGSDDRSYGLHNHPGPFASVVLWGKISEYIGEVATDSLGRKHLTRNCPPEDWPLVPCKRFRYSPKGHTHAVVLQSKFAITLVFTFRWKSPWGFYSPDNGLWRDHHEVLGLSWDD